MSKGKGASPGQHRLHNERVSSLRASGRPHSYLNAPDELSCCLCCAWLERGVDEYPLVQSLGPTGREQLCQSWGCLGMYRMQAFFCRLPLPHLASVFGVCQDLRCSLGIALCALRSILGAVSHRFAPPKVLHLVPGLMRHLRPPNVYPVARRPCPNCSSSGSSLFRAWLSRVLLCVANTDENG